MEAIIMTHWELKLFKLTTDESYFLVANRAIVFRVLSPNGISIRQNC